MSNEPTTKPEDAIIQLEIVSDEAREEDLADVDEAARNIVDHIRSSGYVVNPTYTGKMGGPVFDIIIQAYTVLHDNKEMITTASATLEFINLTLELIKGHIERQKQDKLQTTLTPTSIEITIPTINGPWIVKAPDVDTAIKTVLQLPLTDTKKVNAIKSLQGTKIKTSVAKNRQKGNYRR